MAIIVSHNQKRGRAGALDSLTNKTGAYGGSLGGNKKAGFGISPYMYMYNAGSKWAYRAPQRQPTFAFAIRNTTRNPVQYNRNGYYASHSGLM